MNRLAGAVSPYLVQHADNPVHWWQWGPEAFAEAQRTGRPILLSVGYSACHWCHVMAHESFEDADTAALMNALYVNIKVDREERPDVDHLYMQALHSLGEQGGWPLTMFLDPNGRPFWGGTYFPKVSRYGRPSFTQVLHSVADAFAKRPADIAANATAILTALDAAPEAPPSALSYRWLDAIALRIRDLGDPVHGGLQSAPKFPNPPVLEMLWRAADRSGDESIRAPVLKTLERMARGGIFDHIGGGFARYSVDVQWLVPHFEKMLYDNAQLLPLLALVANKTGSDLLSFAAEETVTWLLRDMLTEGGAFAASEDADSLNPDGHAEEGAFYTWSPDEVHGVLGEATAPFCAAYDIAPGGNFEGRSIPNLLAGTGLIEPLPNRFAAERARLRLHRDKTRARPHRDDKVLADWNGLMIAGLARSATLLARPEWTDAARRAFATVLRLLDDGETLAHGARAGGIVRPGFASDHAAMAVAAIALYEADPTDADAPALLDQAARWCRILLDRYATESGLLAMTVAGSTDLPLRPTPSNDDAVPNANALAAEAMIRLFGITGEPRWRDAADTLLDALASPAQANPYAHAATLNAFDLRLRRADLVVDAPADDPLMREALSVPYTNRTLAGRNSGATPQATVCVDGRCSLPIAHPEQLRARIETDLAPAQTA